MSNTENISSYWRTVDRDPERAARFLEEATRLADPAKRVSIAMLGLQPGATVLDVGCGLGRDAEAMVEHVGPSGRVVGIDFSQELIAKATERTKGLATRPEFLVGDALALEFADDTFDACREDRMLQHLHDPARAMAEMVRATRPRGRVSVLEPDWHTLTIAGGDLAVAQAVTRQRAVVMNRQGDIGRRLVQLLMDAGCDDVDVEGRVLWCRDLGTFDFVLTIRGALEAAMANGAIARDAGEAWWQAMRELDARGRFFASCNVVICAGTVQ